MNIRARAEQEIVKNLNQNISLQEIYLDSSASQLETSMLMMKLINHKDSLNVVPIHLVSTCSQVREVSGAG